MATGSVDRLVKRGYVPLSKLNEAWALIMDEYAVISENTKYKYLLKIIKEIRITENKLIMIQSLVTSLSTGYHTGLANQLRSFGFRFTYNPDNPDKYYQDLKLTVSQAKSMLVRKTERERELVSMKGNEPESEGVTETEYDVYLSELSKYQGYRLNSKEITVSEFFAIVKRYKAEKVTNGRGKNR